jgi:phosphoglycolate phosphatase-like HAD superfamily hydrolase
MKPCYIFDIDGTLADNQHRFHHIDKPDKDWDAYFAACGGDAPIPHMVRLARDLRVAGLEIVYVSGRSDVCREATLVWLAKSYLPRGQLYMRKQGDHKPDHELKVELLAQLRADGHEPIMVFDDRNRVVQAWRAVGIPCAQVAEGDF